VGGGGMHFMDSPISHGEASRLCGRRGCTLWMAQYLTNKDVSIIVYFLHHFSPIIRKLINKFNFDALDVKMIKCKVRYMIHDYCKSSV
jgi:hypothetical protein